MDIQALHTPESWEKAKKTAEFIGPISRLFENCVRSLLEGKEPHEKNFHVLSVFRGPTIKSILYHASRSLSKLSPEQEAELSPEKLLQLFDQKELAAIIASSYVFQRAKKRVDPRMWQKVEGEIFAQAKTGYLVGSLLPEIGNWRGLTTGAIRYIALSLLSIHDVRSFREYHRHINKKDLLFDLEREEELWECNHFQVASILLQALGFGIDAAKAFAITTTDEEKKLSDKDDEIKRWHAVKMWIQCLLEFEEAPDIFPGDKRFAMAPEQLKEIQGKIDGIQENSQDFNWMSKTRKEISQDLARKISFSERNLPSTLRDSIGSETTESEDPLE